MCVVCTSCSVFQRDATKVLHFFYRWLRLFPALHAESSDNATTHFIRLVVYLNRKQKTVTDQLFSYLLIVKLVPRFYTFLVPYRYFGIQLAKIRLSDILTDISANCYTILSTY